MPSSFSAWKYLQLRQMSPVICGLSQVSVLILREFGSQLLWGAIVLSICSHIEIAYLKHFLSVICQHCQLYTSNDVLYLDSQTVCNSHLKYSFPSTSHSLFVHLIFCSAHNICSIFHQSLNKLSLQTQVIGRLPFFWGMDKVQV